MPSSQDTMNVFYFILAFVFFALGIFLFANQMHYTHDSILL